MNKTCSCCKNSKPHSQFYSSKTKKDGLRDYCKLCTSANNKKSYLNHLDKNQSRNRRRYAKNPGHFKERYLKLMYGIDHAAYEALLRKQHGLCAICGLSETATHQNGKIKNLSVDHCHKTGKIRGLLCNKCNRGIGYLSDDPETILKAASYVAMGGV